MELKFKCKQSGIGYALSKPLQHTASQRSRKGRGTGIKGTSANVLYCLRSLKSSLDSSEEEYLSNDKYLIPCQLKRMGAYKVSFF